MEDRVVRLEADVAHIKTDVGEMKQDIRRLDAKVENLIGSVKELRQSVTQPRSELWQSASSLTEDVKKSFTALRVDMREDFALLGKEIKASRMERRIILWLMCAGSLVTTAKVFAWI